MCSFNCSAIALWARSLLQTIKEPVVSLSISESVLVNGKTVKVNYRVKEGDFIRCIIPACAEPEIVPENIPLDILYEDEELIVVNKPKDMVV